jgi:hypothetical protein
VSRPPTPPNPEGSVTHRQRPDDGALPPSFLAVLRVLYRRLSDADINWAVTGSLGFALQGVPSEPADIDIQTDKAGAYEIERLFPRSVVKPVAFSSAERIRSHYGAMVIDGVRVEIMGDVEKRGADGMWEAPVEIRQHARVVEIGGMRVPVLSLEHEYRAYLTLGRTDGAEILRRHFEENA